MGTIEVGEGFTIVFAVIMTTFMIGWVAFGIGWIRKTANSFGAKPTK